MNRTWTLNMNVTDRCAVSSLEVLPLVVINESILYIHFHLKRF